MPSIKNTGKVTPIGLTNGTRVLPGESVVVKDKDFADMQDNEVFQHYVAEGILEIEGEGSKAKGAPVAPPKK